MCSARPTHPFSCEVGFYRIVIGDKLPEICAKQTWQLTDNSRVEANCLLTCYETKRLGGAAQAIHECIIWRRGPGGGGLGGGGGGRRVQAAPSGSVELAGARAGSPWELTAARAAAPGVSTLECSECVQRHCGRASDSAATSIAWSWANARRESSMVVAIGFTAAAAASRLFEPS